MNLFNYQVKEMQNVKKLIDALYTIANPSFEDPAAAKAIWEAVQKALEAQGLNYASILVGQSTISSVLERANETESI